MREIKLIKTCEACPEQYDAFLEEELIGYLRLRHGNFTVSYPDVNGEIIYRSSPKGDGMFNDCEREGFLNIAKKALLERHYSEDNYEGKDI